jgi:hypothetical protein
MAARCGSDFGTRLREQLISPDTVDYFMANYIIDDQAASKTVEAKVRLREEALQVITQRPHADPTDRPRDPGTGVPEINRSVR